MRCYIILRYSFLLVHASLLAWHRSFISSKSFRILIFLHHESFRTHFCRSSTNTFLRQVTAAPSDFRADLCFVSFNCGIFLRFLNDGFKWTTIVFFVDLMILLRYPFGSRHVVLENILGRSFLLPPIRRVIHAIVSAHIIFLIQCMYSDLEFTIALAGFAASATLVSHLRVKR